MLYKISQVSQITTMILTLALIVIGMILPTLPLAVHASGKITIEEEASPARAVPTLKLTEVHANIVQFAEAGDPIEIHLPAETDTKIQWVLQECCFDALAYKGERIEKNRHSRKEAPFRHIFLFKTTAAGRAVVSFVQQSKTLTFIIEVR